MTWIDVQRSLSINESIRYWGAQKGYSYGVFTIVDITERNLKLTIPSGEQLKVYRRDFEKIAPLYQDYVDGAIGSAEIKRQTGRSAYIFSLVHELRDRCKERVPKCPS